MTGPFLPAHGRIVEAPDTPVKVSPDFSVADKLDEARALIEARGWAQDSYCVGGQVCALGAINIVTSGSPTLEFRIGWTDMCDALEAAIGLSTSCDIPIWNDSPKRTQAEVIEAFRKAADLVRSGKAA
jgi:hypothetical protein